MSNSKASKVSAGKSAKSHKKANWPKSKKSADDFEVNLDLIEGLVSGLRASHHDMLERAWKEFKGHPVIFSATLHAMHAAMMKYEVEFIDGKVMSGKAVENGKK